MKVSGQPNTIQTNSINHSQKAERPSKVKGIFSGRTVKNLSSKMAAPFKAMKTAAKFTIDVGNGLALLAKTHYDSRSNPEWDNA